MKIIFVVIVALATVAVCSARFQADDVDWSSAGQPVYCTIDKSRRNTRNICKFYQAIDNEDFALRSPEFSDSIRYFDTSFNKQVKFLPRNIGKKLPNLKAFWGQSCGLTIVRDFYFKNMRELDSLHLGGNQIKKIEPTAFDDLVSLTGLFLWHNQIEALDENIFIKLKKLEDISLSNNKIKFLSPSTFIIPGNGKLRAIDLQYNICITSQYLGVGSFIQLEADIKANCK